jgi:hypothetical protein
MSTHSGEQIVLFTSLIWTKFRDGPAVNKQKSHTFLMERFNLKRENAPEGKEQCCVEISNTFVSMESLHDKVGIDST